MEKMQLLSCPRGGKLSMLLMAMWPAGCTKGWSPYAFRALMLIGPIPVDSPRSLSKWRKLGDPPEKEMATHSSALALRIPGTGEPDGLLSGVAQGWTRLKRLSSSSSSSRRSTGLCFILSRMENSYPLSQKKNI